MNKVRKAVIPVAGYGTRFLPYTKAVPKAMLPVLNKPAIQIISEEVVKSGITDILFVVGYREEVIEDHFRPSEELDKVLLCHNKNDFYKAEKYPESMANFSFIRQKELNGTAKAIEIAEDFAAGEPFAVLFGDDVMYNDGAPVIKQLIDLYEKTGKSVIATMEVFGSDVEKYGNIGIGEENDGVMQVTEVIEKPSLSEALSNNAVIGRYVLSGEVMSMLKKLKPHGKEIFLTDALDKLAKEGKLLASCFEGTRYDVGDKFGYIKANVDYALRSKEIGAETAEFIKETAAKLQK